MKPKSSVFLVFFLLAQLSLILLYTSCSDNGIEKEPLQSIPVSDEVKNSNIQVLGEVFSRLLIQNEEFRTLVWEKALDKDTYDYDVPIAFILEEPLGELTVRDYATNILSEIKPVADLNELIESLNYVQLTIPLHQIQGWKPSVIPYVAVVPVDKSHKEIDSYQGYSPSGNKFLICSKTEPIEQVVVIRESDRIDKNGKLCVNLHGVMLPDEDRMHISEHKSLIDEMKRAGIVKDYQTGKLVRIISDDSLQQIVKQFEIEDQLLRKKREDEQKLFLEEISKTLNSTKNIESNNLTSFSNQPKAISLSWSAVPISGITYKVYAAGYFKSGLLPVYRTKELIATTSSLNATYQFPYENHVYNIWVEGYLNANPDPVSCSNYVSTYTSGRAQGCIEYPNRIFMTASAMRDLEGWAANDLELYWVVSISNTNGQPVQQVTGGRTFYPHYSWLTMQDTERTYTASSFPLFQWNRFAFTNQGLLSNNGAYSVYWYEKDGDRKDKIIQVATKVVRYVAGFYGVNPILTETVLQLANLAFDIDNRDEGIGTCEINWWSPQGFRTFPRSGVVIDFSYQNP